MEKSGRQYLSTAVVAAAVSLAVTLLAFSLRGYVIRDYLAKNPEEMQAIIKDVLANNPAVLRQVIAEMFGGPGGPGESTPDRSAAIKSNAQALFSSPHQVTLGNPEGDVTVVEFFDYNCGYCRRAVADMLTLMKDDPKLRVVLKEFPILSPGSTEAARVAVAVRMQDPTGQKYLEFHQKLFDAPGQADKAKALAAAKLVGLDIDRIEKDMESDEVKTTLDETHKLAQALAIDGTPCYVIGDGVVLGAVGADALKEKVKLARDSAK